MPDYQARMRALRDLAEHPTTPPHEAALARTKLKEMEAKYGKPVTETPPFMDYTTTTSRDGRTWRYENGAFNAFNPFARPPTYKPGPEPPGGWDAYMQDLLNRQHAWNKPPDSDDLIAEEFKYEEDEDYGYDIYEGDDMYDE